MNLSVALGALDVLATVLRERETPVLESSDLLAVLRLLKQVSDVEVQEGEDLEMLEQLGQYYVEVTEVILEQQNIETWSSVSQVTVSPAVWPHLLILVCVQLLGLRYDHRLRTCPGVVACSLSGRVLEFVKVLRAWPWSLFVSSAEGQLPYCSLSCWRCKQVLLQTNAVKWCLPWKPLQWLCLQTSPFVRLDLQDYTQLADSRCSVDSLLPHPVVSGRAMPFAL